MFRIVAAALLAAVLAGCAAAPTTAPRSALRIAQSTEPGTLDPLLLTGAPAEEIGTLIFSYLVRVDARGTLVPDLVTRVPSLANGDIARDGRTIIYHLRRGVRWHDGTAFSAADAIATVRAILDPRNPVPTRLGFDRIASIDAPNPLTLRVRLRAPFAPFITYFFETENYPILPARRLARHPVLAATELDTAPIGTGPYRLERWKRGDVLQLHANPTYYGGEPHVERIAIHFITSTQTIVQELRTGELDAAFATDPTYVDRLRENPALAVVSTPIYGFESLTFQTTDPALVDVRVRQALARVFDLPRAIARAAHGALPAANAARGLFSWAYRPLAPPAAAHVGLPRHLTLAIDASRATDRAVAIALQADARAAGIDLAVKPYAAQVLYAPARDRGPLNSGRFQLALHPILSGADPETAWLLACDQLPPQGFNVSRYCNASVDMALAAGLQTFDRARRMSAYRIVQTAIARDVPFLAAWELRTIDAVPAGLRGFSPSPESPFYLVERWRLRGVR